MKKSRILISIICAVLALCMCTGCDLGSYRETPGTTGGQSQSGEGTGNNGDKIDAPTDTADTPYTATLYYNNAPFYYEGIKVYWRGETELHTVDLDESGKASAGVLDGDFDVYLSGLPQGYSYDPSAYRATGDERHVDILIVSLKKPIQGNGGVTAKNENDAKYRSGGCYVISAQGTYSVTCEEGQYLYFEYKPTTAGVYSIESWCNIYEDSINPMVAVYGGDVGYKYYIETRDTGGAALDGGFTKNFRYEISVYNVGPTYTFGVTAVSKSGEYPVTFDFAIVREGDCSASSSTVIVNAKETIRIDKPEVTDTYVYADYPAELDGKEKVFDADKFRYYSAWRVYRVYDEERYASTDGWGPPLCCDITKLPPSYGLTTLYAANVVSDFEYNFLKLTVIDDDGSYLVYDYTSFIRDSYYSKCNADGRCYVTKELMEFLSLYASVRNLWTDGVAPDPNMPEGKGYSATQDALWLFACGYYI